LPDKVGERHKDDEKGEANVQRDDSNSSGCESEYSADREEREADKARKKRKKRQKAVSKNKPAMLHPDEVLRLGGKETIN
jgi:hypothetical protein